MLKSMEKSLSISQKLQEKESDFKVKDKEKAKKILLSLLKKAA